MRFLLLTLLNTFAAVAPLVAASDMEVAEVIRQAEGSAWYQVGSRGERSEWQICPATWYQFSRHPFAWASSPCTEHREEVRRVAVAYVHWIRAQLPSLGLPDSVYTVALAWNAGYGRVECRRFSAGNYSFARRALSVYIKGKHLTQR